MQRVARQWKAQNGLTTQVEAQQKTSQARHFLPRGEETRWRSGRVGDIPDDGMGCSTQTFRSSSLERLPWSEIEDLETTVKFHLANENLCNLAIASGFGILLHETNLDMRCIDTSCERNAGTIYDYRMARMYEYRHVVASTSQHPNLHVDILAHQTQPVHFASMILGLCLLCVGFSK